MKGLQYAWCLCSFLALRFLLIFLFFNYSLLKLFENIFFPSTQYYNCEQHLLTHNRINPQRFIAIC